LKPKEKILFMATGAQHLTEHIGVFTPKAQDRESLSAGRSLRDCRNQGAESGQGR